MMLRLPRVMPLGHMMLSVTKATRSAPFNPLFSILASSPQSVQYMKLKKEQRIILRTENLRTEQQSFSNILKRSLTYSRGRLRWLSASPGCLWSGSSSCCRLSLPQRSSSESCRSSRCCHGSSPQQCPPGPRSHCQLLQCGGRSHRPCPSWSCQGRRFTLETSVSSSAIQPTS